MKFLHNTGNSNTVGAFISTNCWKIYEHHNFGGYRSCNFDTSQPNLRALESGSVEFEWKHVCSCRLLVKRELQFYFSSSENSLEPPCYNINVDVQILYLTILKMFDLSADISFETQNCAPDLRLGKSTKLLQNYIFKQDCYGVHCARHTSQKRKCVRSPLFGMKKIAERVCKSWRHNFVKIVC